MNRYKSILIILFLSVVNIISVSAQDITRGEYISYITGCYTCHTDIENNGPAYAGGREFITPFGKFYSPNITSNIKNGIGNWTNQDFINALTKGISPKGEHYYPIFPYTSYKYMSYRDIVDLKAYLFSLDANSKNFSHKLKFLFKIRKTLFFWKILYFESKNINNVDKPLNFIERGRYLVQIGHCSECHTPRNFLGGTKNKLFLAGTNTGIIEKNVSNITHSIKYGIGDWSEEELIYLLKTGVKPDFDEVQGSMKNIIDYGTKYLTDLDLLSISKYLKSIKPIERNIK